jgi:hypothetical protein
VGRNRAARLITSAVFPVGILAAGLLTKATSTTVTLLLLASWQMLLALSVIASPRHPEGTTPVGGAGCEWCAT